MAKKQKDIVNIKFHGSTVDLRDVEVISIGRGRGGMFVHLEIKHDRARLIHTESPVIKKALNEGQVLIDCKTIDDSLRYLKVRGDEQIVIAITKGVRIKVEEQFMHLDAMTDGGYRLCYSTGLIDNTAPITIIEINKVIE